MRTFPKDFDFGVATASYQIEGAVNEGGRSKCIWTTYSATPGKVINGDSGELACDHYHRYKEDIALMKKLGVKVYRFSLSWPRIIPGGTGKINPEGITFYKNLIAEIKAAGITPVATLYHWDLPQIMEDQGGWENRETVFAFEAYAKACFEAFGDEVPQWITINEPFCVTHLGYLTGAQAPGKKLSIDGFFNTVHHINLAHGVAVKAYREAGLKGKIGVTVNLLTPRPATQSEKDKEAVRLNIDFNTRIYTDPVFKGTYPESLKETYPEASFPIEPGDMELISQKTDFMGINYYSESAVEADPEVAEGRYVTDSYERTDMGWPITPLGLLRQLRWVKNEYHPEEIFITENGACYPDGPVNGRVVDTKRIDYLRKHFKACLTAIEEGIPLKGYYLWSFMDNFEWSYGYAKRFGIVHVDYKTQERTPKDSFYYYREVVNGWEEF